MQEKFTKIRNELRKMEHDYYVLNRPTKSDFEYDVKLKQLEALEQKHPEYKTNDSPTQRIGVDQVKGFDTIKHAVPMLSLKNTYILDEIGLSVPKGSEYVTELKYDGLAIGLLYKGGFLVQALTRGDGEFGDDVLANILTIKSIPMQIPFSQGIEIRGEIVMPKAIFEKLNKEKEENGEELFKNARNAAAGSVRSHHPKDTAKRGLDFYGYAIVNSENTQSEDLEYLEQLGFKTWQTDPNLPLIVKRSVHTSIDTVKSFINVWEKYRHNLPYDIDGIVIKVNDKTLQKSIGFGSKYPKWAQAYKYKAEEKSTKILNVIYQVGILGSITPVAELEPIELSGSTVKRVTLNNFKWIQEKDLHVDDYVVIEKGGEIIPKLLRVDLSKRLEGSTPIITPTNCPCCGSVLVQRKNQDGTISANHYCENSEGCLGQIVGRLGKFCSKKAMNIVGIGPRTIKILVDGGHISSPESLYELTNETLVSCIGEVLGNKLYKEIQDSKDKPYFKLLYALSIPKVGTTASKQLVELFPDLVGLSNTSFKILLDAGISELIANNLIEFWTISNKEMVLALKSLGLSTTQTLTVQASESLSGDLVVISGNFGTATNKEHLKQLVDAHGGKLQSSVNGKTSYVVAGEKMGWKKKEQCEKLGIKIITEEDFLKKLEK